MMAYKIRTAQFTQTNVVLFHFAPLMSVGIVNLVFTFAYHCFTLYDKLSANQHTSYCNIIDFTYLPFINVCCTT